jgi:hypothetical protein
MKKLIIGLLCLFAIASALQWKVLGNAGTWYVFENTFRAESFNQVWLGNAFAETLLQYDVGGQDALFFKGTVGYQIKWGLSPVVQYEYGSWGASVFRAGVRWCYYFGGEL